MKKKLTEFKKNCNMIVSFSYKPRTILILVLKTLLTLKNQYI